MHIVIDARAAGDHFPGIGRYIFSLVAALAARNSGHRLTLLVAGGHAAQRFDLASLARQHQLATVAVGAAPFSLAEHVLVPRALRALRADLYHAPFYARPVVGLPCPAVTTLYDAIPLHFPALVSGRARAFYGLMQRLAIRASRCVIAISHSARADLIAAYGAAPERTFVTPLAADRRYGPQPPVVVDAVRSRMQIAGRYVLSLSSDKPHKNIEGLLLAWALLARARAPGSLPQLVLAGHRASDRQGADALVQTLGLQHSVLSLPNLPEDDLPAIYAGAQAFVFPSLYEGFGLPPLEAMACGTPVICGAGSSLPEVAGDAALMVDMRDIRALAAALGRVLGDDEVREQMRAAGLRRAAQFSWERTARLTLAVYELARMC
jgi:alpha-1,3-rhamnosyl/mannosyltransferase